MLDTQHGHLICQKAQHYYSGEGFGAAGSIEAGPSDSHQLMSISKGGALHGEHDGLSLSRVIEEGTVLSPSHTVIRKVAIIVHSVQVLFIVIYLPSMFSCYRALLSQMPLLVLPCICASHPSVAPTMAWSPTASHQYTRTSTTDLQRLRRYQDIPTDMGYEATRR